MTSLFTNPLIKKWIGSIVRAGVVAIGARAADWSDGDVDQIVNALMVLGGVAWGLYEKWQSSRLQNTTLAVGNQLTGPGVPNLTKSDIEAVIKSGDAAPAATPTTRVPILHGTGDGMRRLRNATGKI